MFNKVGVKIKILSIVFFVLEIIAIIIGIVLAALNLKDEVLFFTILAIIVGGLIVAYFLAILFYGFGEIVEHVESPSMRKTKNSYSTIKETKEVEHNFPKVVNKKEPNLFKTTNESVFASVDESDDPQIIALNQLLKDGLISEKQYNDKLKELKSDK